MFRDQEGMFSTRNLNVNQFRRCGGTRQVNSKKNAAYITKMLSAYLWIHGIGFTGRTHSQLSCCLATSISAALFVLFEGSFIIAIHNYAKIVAKAGSIPILSSTTFIFLALNFCIRCFLYTRRRDISNTIRRLLKINAKVNTNITVTFKSKLLFALLLNDLVLVVVNVLAISTHTRTFMGYLGDNLYIIGIPPPHSTPVYYTYYLTTQMSAIGPAVVVYFCSICLITKCTFLEIENKLNREPEKNKLMFQVYTEVTEAVSDINERYHAVLIITFSYYLLVVFRETYVLLFTSISSKTMIVYTILIIIMSFLNFMMMCVFGSYVSAGASKVKSAVLGSMSDLSIWDNLRFSLKVNEDFGFVLLGSIKIDSSLILAAVGAVMSYGIIVATFNSS